MHEPRPVVATPPLNLGEILHRGHWQEVALLTYSFDLPFFESYLLPILVGAGCHSISVASCASWLPDRLRSWATSGEVREAGRSYTVSPVSVPGVFHPKVILACGDHRGVVMVGSGNISQYGMAMGGELFTLEEWDDDGVPHLAIETWQLCREVGRQLLVDRAFLERIEAIGRLVPALASPIDEHVLLHNLSEPILGQFLTRLSGAPVDDLVVWSPFTDEKLEALDALVEGLSPRRVTLGVQSQMTKLDGERLVLLQKRHRDMSWEVRTLEQPDSDQPSMIHAKGILASLTSGEQIALVGSPNLSTPALLRTSATGNFEVAVLHHGANLREELFGEGSVIRLGRAIDPRQLTWAEDPTTAYQRKAGPVVQLLGARLDRDWLGLEISGDPPSGTAVLLDAELRRDLTHADAGWGTALDGGMAPRTAELIWKGGSSGPVVVADIARLAAMRVGRETRAYAPLEALDYGADRDILELLDQLSQLAIGSVNDVERMLRGAPAPSPQEEAAEAAGEAPLVRLEDIDFDRIKQHPRALAYVAGAEYFETPRIQLWLDEVVQQFEQLRNRQLLRIVTPVLTGDDEEETEILPQIEERRRWRVSRRIAVRVRNRLRRYVNGVRDPRFWRLVDSEWMAKNYVLFLSLLQRLWARAWTPEAILSPDDLAPLTLDLLVGYWGDDRGGGYLSEILEEDRQASAALITQNQGDALSAAASIVMLEAQGEIRQAAPFVVGAYMRQAEVLGLIAEDVVERALIFLDRADESPDGYHKQLLGAAEYFTWERFAANLAWRHRLRSAAVLSEVPDLGPFPSGDVFVADPGGNEDAPIAGTTLRVFAEWVQEVRRRDPERDMIHMSWGTRTILMYDTLSKEVLVRGGASAPELPVRTVAIGVAPEEIASLDFNEVFTATA